MPQPLKALAKDDYDIEWDAVKAFEKYPELGLLVAKCNATWAAVERGIANFVIDGLGANARVAMAMLASLTSTAAQAAAMNAVADSVLPIGHSDRPFYNAAMNIFKTQAKHRNKLVHHIWGVEKRNTPDCLILTDPAAMTDWMWQLKYAEMPKPLNGEDGLNKWLESKKIAIGSTFTYSKKDLDILLRDFQETGEIWHLIAILVDNHSAAWVFPKDRTRQMLTEKPLMREALRP